MFNALTNSSKAQAENFPFCTIDPNIGLVVVPDERLDKLAKIFLENPDLVYKYKEKVDVPVHNGPAVN